MKKWIPPHNIHSLLFKSSLPSLDTELLLAFVTKKNREWILTHTDYVLSLPEYIRFVFFSYKRARQTPLAHITKTKDFFGLPFFVNKHTLVPRPDTEILVEEVLKCDLSGHTLVDIGTGSSCIPIAIAKTATNSPEKILATDISKNALAVAKKNAQAHGISISFFHGSLLDPIKKITTNTPLIITANLPYLTEKQFCEEPSIKKEPKSALVAADNGLFLYKKFVQQLKTYTQGPLSCFFEIDPTQKQELTTYIRSVFPDARVRVVSDYAKHDRIVHFSLR